MVKYKKEVREFIKECCKEEDISLAEIQRRIKVKFQLHMPISCISHYTPDDKFATKRQKYLWKNYCQQEYLLTEQGKRFLETSQGVFRDIDGSRLVQLLDFFNEKTPTNLEEAANSIIGRRYYRIYFKKLVKRAIKLGYITKPGKEPADLESRVKQKRKALPGDETTKSIYKYIKKNPGTYPGRISHDLIINYSSVYKHLKILELNGLINSEKKDRHTHYYTRT